MQNISDIVTKFTLCRKMHNKHGRPVWNVRLKHSSPTFPLWAVALSPTVITGDFVSAHLFIYNLFPNGNKSGLAASALYRACYNKLWWLHTISFILRNGSICIHPSGEQQAFCDECSGAAHVPGERWRSARVWPPHLLLYTVKHLQLTCNVRYHVNAAWIVVILCYVGMVTWEACAWSLQVPLWRP